MAPVNAPRSKPNLVAARIGPRLVAAQREECPEVVRERGVVVHDGDERLLQDSGSEIGSETTMAVRGFAVSQAPTIGDQTRPPCRSTTRRAIGSASPMPPRFSSNEPDRPTRGRAA